MKEKPPDFGQLFKKWLKSRKCFTRCESNSRLNGRDIGMAHDYLIEIHNYISEQIASAESRKAEAQESNDKDSQKFYEGQLAEWRWMRTYLAEKVDLKTQKYF